MKQLFLSTFLIFSFSINASTIAIFKCELLDDHKIDEVKTINSEWVKAVNKINESTNSKNQENDLELTKIYKSTRRQV